MDLTLEETCNKYSVKAALGLVPVHGSRRVIGLSGLFPEPRECATVFTLHDWLDEPVAPRRVLLASFTDLISYWSRKRGEKYFSFSSQRTIELREVRSFSTRLKALLDGVFDEFLTAAYPELYVNSFIRDVIRPCVQYKGGRKNLWRRRPEPSFQGDPEVCFDPFGDAEEEGS